MSIQLQTPDYMIVYVIDMQRSVAFYRDTLGLALKFSSPGWSEFVTGATTLALHTSLNTSQEAASRSTKPEGLPMAGQANIGFVVDDLQAAYETLKAQDVYFSLPPQKQRAGRTLAVLHDPDGFGITLQQR
jgi:lactoylglutathione lyase